MSKIHSWSFRVRSYETDATSQVSPAVYLNYLEEGAIQASGVLGYDFRWYWANHRVWVVRKMTIRYYEPVTIDDDLELQTWVSDFRRVQSNRDYSLRRVSDGAQVVRGRANWVYINTDTLMPARVDEALIAQFEPTGVLEPLDAEVIDPVAVEDAIPYTEEWRVQYAELDGQGHVNNAVYQVWTDQAILNALHQAGWTSQRMTDSGFAMHAVANQIEYFHSALDDEPMKIRTWLSETGQDRASWTTEIRHSETDELIARNVTVRGFTDAHGPCPLPAILYLPFVQRA